MNLKTNKSRVNFLRVMGELTLSERQKVIDLVVQQNLHESDACQIILWKKQINNKRKG